ncbi:SRPBCC domain-containing protein [Cellulomonas sp. 179-A 9B4 NHS]|uniref:SRPBCC domain-containing protein n=1 Tax=Cellulomonas sp. 179-A 9B4 NHS TaxID=3142379 RepID=UPI0039A04D27
MSGSTTDGSTTDGSTTEGSTTDAAPSRPGATTSGTTTSAATSERVYRVHVAASPEAAWAALTEPGRTRAWYYGTAARTTWEVGSPVEYVDGDGTPQIRGTVLAHDPPRTLSHTFVAVWSGAPDDQGVLTWTVEPEGDGCCVTLVHAGGHGTETAEGSAYLVEALKQHLEPA